MTDEPNTLGPVEAADKIAGVLDGTCMSLQEALAQNDLEGMDNNLTFCATLDQQVFCCEVCNWWFDNSEMHDDTDGPLICTDCGDS